MSVLNLLGLIAAILSLQATKEATAVSCPGGFVQTGASYSDCWLLQDKKNRDDAETACARAGGSLVEIFTVNDQLAATFFGSQLDDKLPGQEPLWIGASYRVPGRHSDKSAPGPLSWDSGASITVNFMNRPSSADTQCVCTSGMFWYSVKCSDKHRSICRKASQCPAGSMSMTTNGPCFKYFDKKMNQQDAYSACGNAGSTLANLQNVFDSEAVNRLAGGDKVWIGLETKIQLDATKSFIWTIPYKYKGKLYKYGFPLTDYTNFENKDWAIAPNGDHSKGCYYSEKGLWKNKEYCNGEKFKYVCRLRAGCPMISVANAQVKFVGNTWNGYGTQIEINCNPGYNILGPFRMSCAVVNLRTGESRFFNPVFTPKCVAQKPLCKTPVYPGTKVTAYRPLRVHQGSSSYVVAPKFTLECTGNYTSLATANGAKSHSFATSCIYTKSTTVYWGFLSFSPPIPANGICTQVHGVMLAPTH